MSPPGRSIPEAHQKLGLFLILLLSSSGVSYAAGKEIGLPTPAAQHLQAEPPSEPTKQVAAASPTASPPAPTILPPTAPATTPPAGPAMVARAAPPPPPVRMVAQVPYANTYTYGYCTYYVASRRPIPPRWGNASAWHASAQRAGWSVGAAPRVGAIAWTPASGAGHVALVEKIDGIMIYISEMNYNGNWNRVTSRWANAASFQYIY
jgi:surface antigen